MTGLALLLLAFLAQILIPVAVLLAGRQVARAIYARSMQHAWSGFHALALASPDHVRLARLLPGPTPAVATDDEIRLRGLNLALLDAFQASYLAARHAPGGANARALAVRDLLTPLVTDDALFSLSQRPGFRPEFQAECRKLRAELEPAGEGGRGSG